ncbi:MAG TPA: DUF2269 family protein [Actinomycetota bacterium]
MRWVVFLHVAIAFWFVAGLLGRDITIAKARSSEDLDVIGELMELAGRFERFMVVPGSIAVLVAGLLAAWAQGRPLAGSGNWWLLTSLVLYVGTFALVPLVFLPRGKVFERALTDARERGVVTPDLVLAFRDPAVRWARTWETVMVLIVIALMVVKPF